MEGSDLPLFVRERVLSRELGKEEGKVRSRFLLERKKVSYHGLVHPRASFVMFIFFFFPFFWYMPHLVLEFVYPFDTRILIYFI